MCRPAVMHSVSPTGGKAVTTMLHDLAARHLAQQRSEQLIRDAERQTLAAALRPTRSGRLGRRIASMVARVTTSRRQPGHGSWSRAPVGQSGR